MITINHYPFVIFLFYGWIWWFGLLFVDSKHLPYVFAPLFFMSMHWGHPQNTFLFVFVPQFLSKFSVHPNTHLQLQMLTGLGACSWIGKEVKDPNAWLSTFCKIFSNLFCLYTCTSYFDNLFFAFFWLYNSILDCSLLAIQLRVQTMFIITRFLGSINKIHSTGFRIVINTNPLSKSGINRVVFLTKTTYHMNYKLNPKRIHIPYQ